MTEPSYGFFDCDTHCYETRDAATRYLPKKYLDRAITTVHNANGDDMVLAGHRFATFNSEGGVGFDYAYKPGSLKEILKQMASAEGDGTFEPDPMQVEYVEREPREKVLAEQGVERCVLFPGALALSAEGYVDDTEALYASLSAYNRWFDETWGFNRDDRIYPTAVLSLRDLDSAVALTDEILAKGARVVLLPTGPAYGRSPGDPYFDPVWARLEEAGVIVALHIMPNWYFDNISPAWGHNADPASWHMSAWQWMHLYGERPVVETVSALIFDNLFGRFPQLKLLVAEHGATWIPKMLEHMDKSRGMGRNGPWVGGQLTERPSKVFKRHVRVTPYPEDDVPRIVDELDGDDRVLVFGSDYPHASGVAQPVDFLDTLGDLPDDTKRRIMRDNAEEFFQLGS
jgi:predicted TIM-barrel fold metal-dependent hydrolase